MLKEMGSEEREKFAKDLTRKNYGKKKLSESDIEDLSKLYVAKRDDIIDVTRKF